MRICRTLGTSKLRNLDPFLMLDELRMPAKEASAGFPDHPHRGFETCSIMLSGKMEHHDSVGNQVSPRGILLPDLHTQLQTQLIKMGRPPCCTMMNAGSVRLPRGWSLSAHVCLAGMGMAS